MLENCMIVEVGILSDVVARGGGVSDISDLVIVGKTGALSQGFGVFEARKGKERSSRMATKTFDIM